MNYECPSCYMCWEDDLEPLGQISHPLCVFCSNRHTQKELLNWQIDHLDNMYAHRFPKVFRNYYRYVEKELRELNAKLDNQQKSS